MTWIDRRSPWKVIVMVALAIAGVLSMHGLEAAFVHESHFGPAGHLESASVSSVERHVSHGTCDVDGPQVRSTVSVGVCAIDAIVTSSAASFSNSAYEVGRLANRAVLTAFSILRV